MQFNVVIGNPPYQEETQSIYQHFIDLGIAISRRHVCMIVKNNWLNSNTLKSTRDNMINAGLKEVINYPVIGEVFRGVTPTVTIFAIDKAFKSKTHYKEIIDKQVVSEYVADLHNTPVIVTNKLEQTILDKVSVDSIRDNLGSNVLGAKYFWINTNGAVGFSGTSELLRDTKNKISENDLQVVYMDSDKTPYVRYLNPELLPKGSDIVDKYKVICGRTTSRGKNVITNINVAKPKQVTTASWGILYTSDSKEEAMNVANYIRTKFVRFLVGIMCSDGVQGINSTRFELVPMQDFSKPWTDQELYTKYGLTAEEISYIEKTINPMSGANQSSQPSNPKLDRQDYEAAAMNMALKKS